jgi:zinc D-Ala-D-Ala carboxypeptidase
MSKRTKKRLLLIIPLLFIITLVGVVLARNETAVAPSASAPASSDTPASSKGSQPAAFNKKQFSTDEPTSQWVVVNKHRPLTPKTYEPAVTVPNVPLRLSKDSGEMHVASTMAPALEQLFKAATDAKVPLMLASGYRSYQLQVSVYNAEVKNNGQAGADRESARPGYSEHQTGLAADLEPVSRQCEVAACFGQLPEGKWLAANAAAYGFIIRYPENRESTTGYVYEPWHVRYVGIPLAQELKTKNIDTLESFFGLGAAPDYQ